MTLDQQVLRISLARLASLGHELRLKHGRVRISPAGASSPLVAIRAPRHSGLAPLFLIHPVGGSVIGYHELAHHMRPDQPIYAIENQIAFRPELAPTTTIEEMAERYLHEVRAVRSRGPLLFGGYSMGGVVAFEMARQARAGGQAVGAAILIDTPARIRDLGEPPRGELGARELSLIARMIASRQEREICISDQDLERLAPDERLAHLVDVLKQAGVLPGRVDAPLLRALLTVVRSNELAQRRYVPGPYDGDLLLLRSNERSPELLAEAPDVYDDPSFGWQGVCARPVTVERVPGEHLRMLNPPHVYGLGAALQRHLDPHQSEKVIAPY